MDRIPASAGASQAILSQGPLWHGIRIKATRCHSRQMKEVFFPMTEEIIEQTEAAEESTASSARREPIAAWEAKLGQTGEAAKEKLEEFGDNKIVRTVSNMLMIGLLLGCVAFGIYGWRKGIFASPETLRDWVDSFGMTAPMIFTILQALEVGIPVIPGGVTLLAGVLLFGPWWGFWYNYVGIVIGSLATFAISRVYGKPLMHRLFSKESIEKYEHWTEDHGRFRKLFAVAIFLPGAPDGLICYLAGTTRMSWKTYTLIILFCKPLSIAMYSLGMLGISKGISFLGTVLF